MKYLVDSNILITAYRTFYNFTFGNNFWNFLLQEAKEGRLASIDKVLVEINKGDDELKNGQKRNFQVIF